MPYENPLLEVLTFRECIRWCDRDAESYNNWIKRMNSIDYHFLETGKKLPRHRYNSDPRKP